MTRKGVNLAQMVFFGKISRSEMSQTYIHKCTCMSKRKKSNVTILWCTCTLLRFNKSCRPLNADNQTACHLGIKSSTMSSFLHSKNPSDPCHYLSVILLKIVIVSPGTHLVKNHECSQPRTNESQ